MSKLLVHLTRHINLNFIGRCALNLQLFTFLKSLTNFAPDPSINQDKISKYWTTKSIDQVIQEADLSFSRGEYLEVYELLNRLKFSHNPEVQWRTARALFKLSCQNDIEEEYRHEIIEEAFDIISTLLDSDPTSAQIHKWAAIIIDRRNGMKGIEQRIKNSEVVKQHLIKSCELDPSDVTSQYLLGRWCYEMSNITWFQKIIAKLLYGEPPESSFEEAHHYLSRAEDLHPRFYLQNTYFLGKTCLKLGQYYRARHYFEVVGNLPVHNEYDRHCATEAKKLLKRLEKYNLEKTALFYEYPFGTNE